MTSFSPAEIDQLRADVGRVLLDQVCDIRRNVGTTNPYGHPSVNWQPHLTNVPCHLLTLREREIVGPLIIAAQTFDYLDVPFGTDVTESDEISEIRNQKGEVIGENYRIQGVTARPSHLLITMRSDDG